MPTSADFFTISSIYLAYYGRPADPSGLQFWARQLEARDNNLNTIINAFATSSEAQGRFGGLSNTAFINNVYQSLFSRPAEPGGLAYWNGRIQSGDLSLGQATLAILQGAQNSGAQDSTLVTLRNTTALQFTQSLGTTGAYFGNAAADAATLLIASVQLGATPSQINSLILAANQLVQMASAQPDAYNTLLGTGNHALGLLGTAAGSTDPLGLIQTLGNILDTAAREAGPNGNPSTALQKLLGEENSFLNVLTNLPSGVTVQDVNNAVNNGGLANGGQAAETGGGTTPPPHHHHLILLS